MKRFEVYENNAGSLYLCVLENGECVHIVEGWEWNAPGTLRDALNELKADEAAYTIWDGDLIERLNDDGMEDATAASIYQEGLGTLIVDTNENGSSCIVDEDMIGCAGRRALGIE